MRKIKLNIFSSLQEYENLISVIKELLINNSETQYVIQLLSMKSDDSKESLIEIEVEYPLIGKSLIELCDEFSNLDFDKNVDWENSHISNRVVISYS